MSEEEIRVMLVDDEEDILEFLAYNLTNEGYKVSTATNGQEAIQSIDQHKPHLIVLDIMMPGLNGIEVCEKIRQNNEWDDILIAFLTARSESFTHVSALDSGADDFITKPVKPNVFKSRVKAILRRHPHLKSQSDKQILNFGALTINFDEYIISKNQTTIKLAKKEFELLKLLVSRPGKVFKRAEILQKVWGSEVIVGDRTIDVHVRKLREKIGSEFIQTIKGVGYKFVF